MNCIKAFASDSQMNFIEISKLVKDTSSKFIQFHLVSLAPLTLQSLTLQSLYLLRQIYELSSG
jgi:hypothetical protein